ncbi:phage tail protein [Paracidovorax valerianellae]|uniref:phage tail protein n=1 Tax=Paracidovorax valerianellae TaxID=187868 RepID=UPI0023038D70|nr:tail fiber protein [Paracidovorax valerianellae]MDA8444026.1 tail fiber protein [Paracidovorax valerianellae]
MASDPFLGEITLFAGNFAPKNWAFCWGQTLAISQNSALFSLLGTTYGGNGQTTFALPDLRGRVPLGMGQGPGLSNFVQGEMGGRESVTLTSNQLPTHSHSTVMSVSSSPGNSAAPDGKYLAASNRRDDQFTDQSPDGNLAGLTSGPAGGNQPHENMQPYLALNFIIALQGLFPSRN